MSLQTQRRDPTGDCLAHRGLLDAGADPALDRLTRLAARVLGAPVAVVGLRVGDELLLRSQVGLSHPATLPRSVPVESTLSREMLRTGQPLILTDLAAAGAGVPPGTPAAQNGARAFAGVPLVRAGGHAIGVFAVMDRAVRQWTDDEIATLRDLAASVLTEIEWRLSTAESASEAEGRRQDEERFRLMVEGSEEVFFYTHDLEGRFEYVSPSVHSVLGYTPDELVGHSYRKLLVESANAEVERRTHLTLRGEGDRSVYTAETRHRDGRVVAVELVEGAVRVDGRVVGVQGFARDITERRRAEEELRLRTAYLAHLIDRAPEAIVVLDPAEERVLRINREFTRTFGYEPAEAVGRLLSTLIVPDGSHDEADGLGRRVAGGETIEVRAVRRRKDGSLLNVSILATPVLVDGAPTAIYGIYRDISKQVRAEEAVRRSEEHFRALIEHSSDVVDILDPDGVILYATPSIGRALGIDADAVTGRSILEFVHPDDRARAEEALRRGVEEQGESRAIEVRVRHRDGSWRYFEAVARNLLDNPAVGGIVLTSRDVTSRREAAAELQRNAAILAAIPDAVVVTDVQGRVTYWNEGAVRQFGWTAEEVLGRALAARMPADLKPRFAGELRRALAGEEIHGEYEDARRDGSRILTDTRVSPIRDEAGQATAVLRISRDITEQRLLGRVLEEMPEAVVCLDAADRIVACNAAAERTFGYSAAEMLGQPVSILAPEERARGAAVPDFTATTRHNGGWSGEVVRRRKDGTHFPVRLTTGVVRDSQGHIIGQAGLMRDLTEEKHREAQVRRAERMTGLGTLLSGLAHELNNPLTSIKSFAQLLLLDERSAEDRDGLEVIHQEADRAAQLVSDLRLLARQTREMAMPARELVDLNELAQQVLLSRFAAEPPAFRVREELSVETAPVWGDRFRLEQMLRQLVLNAEQALQDVQPPGELVVCTRRVEGGVELSVTDTGRGIGPAELDRIFDPFYTTKAPGEGIGLGLSMVHTIVTEHGAEIRVESEPGRGTSFTVVFPRQPVRTGASAPSPRADGTLRVLLVEDEAPIRTALARFLEQRGHEVHVAEHGLQALEHIERGESFDVIVTDLRMPGLSGDELYRRLLERGDTEQKLVIVSGDPAEGGFEAYFSAAGIPVVGKPFDFVEIAQLIEREARGG